MISQQEQGGASHGLVGRLVSGFAGPVYEFGTSVSGKRTVGWLHIWAFRVRAIALVALWLCGESVVKLIMLLLELVYLAIGLR